MQHFVQQDSKDFIALQYFVQQDYWAPALKSLGTWLRGRTSKDPGAESLGSKGAADSRGAAWRERSSFPAAQAVDALDYWTEPLHKIFNGSEM